MKYLVAVTAILTLALGGFSCADNKPSPGQYFVVNGISIDSAPQKARKLVSRMSSNSFKTDDVPPTGQGMITCVGESNAFFVYSDGKLSEYFFTEVGDSGKKYNRRLNRLTKLYGSPNPDIGELPEGAFSHNHSDKPALFAFWIAPDNNSVLLLELSRVNDTVLVTLKSLVENPLSKEK